MRKFKRKKCQMFINHSSREVTAKIVYYGPGLSGKTTNLQYIFSVTNPQTRGELISIETEIERTLFFDLLPINVGLINGYQTKFQLYTVPGQVFYDSTRKLVLKGADGIVFVADSQQLMKQSNIESLENLRTNLSAHKLVLDELPAVLQYNKRDLASIFTLEELNSFLNKKNVPFFSAVAINGKGVLETLRGISTLILKKIKILLEHPTDEYEEISIPTVEFNINKKHKIIDREKLPLKKIYAENLEAASSHLEPTPPEFSSMPEEETFESNEPKDFEMEEVLKVETVETKNEYKDLDEFMLSSHEDETISIEGLEEIKLDEDEEEPFLLSQESTNEFEEGKEPQPPETQENMEFDLTEIEELNALPGLDEQIVPPAHETETTTSIPPTPPRIDRLKELESLARTPNKKTGTPTPQTKKESKEILQIEALKKSLSEKPTQEKEFKNDPSKLQNLELFERLKDKTRLTILKNIPMTDPEFVIEIKDKNSNVLDTLQVRLSPEIKKVSLIIDVKK